MASPENHSPSYEHDPVQYTWYVRPEYALNAIADPDHNTNLLIRDGFFTYEEGSMQIINRRRDGYPKAVTFHGMTFDVIGRSPDSVFETELYVELPKPASPIFAGFRQRMGKIDPHAVVNVEHRHIHLPPPTRFE